MILHKILSQRSTIVSLKPVAKVDIPLGLIT